jgi:hypothetical protein
MRLWRGVLIGVGALALAGAGALTYKHFNEPQFPTPLPTVSQTLRAPLTTPTAKVFVGSINSNKYHYPSCTAAKRISLANEVWFNSSADARSHHYVPCQICKPP